MSSWCRWMCSTIRNCVFLNVCQIGTRQRFIPLPFLSWVTLNGSFEHETSCVVCYPRHIYSCTAWRVWETRSQIPWWNVRCIHSLVWCDAYTFIVTCRRMRYHIHSPPLLTLLMFPHYSFLSHTLLLFHILSILITGCVYTQCEYSVHWQGWNETEHTGESGRQSSLFGSQICHWDGRLVTPLNTCLNDLVLWPHTCTRTAKLV